MNNTKLLILVWIAGWITCSIIYIVSSFSKAKYLNENWSFLNSIAFVPMLFIIWPFTLVIYVWFNIRLRVNNSVELPEGLEVVELSKRGSKTEKAEEKIP
jgi:hypothetical protein